MNKPKRSLTKKKEPELKNIESTDLDDILNLTQRKSIMRYIGNGKIWDRNKCEKFISYSLKERNMKDTKRQNYYYKIVKNKTFMGLIGFHTFPILGNKNYYLTIYFLPEFQGTGLLSISLDLLIKKIKKHKPQVKRLYSLVKDDNKKMLAISRKKFTFDRLIKLQGKRLNQFVIYLDVPAKFKKYQKKFYLFKSNYFHRDMVAKIFKNINVFQKQDQIYWEEYDLQNPPKLKTDILYLDYINESKNPKYKKILNQLTEMKSILGDDKFQIINKDNLYLTLAKTSQKPKYLLPQFNLDIKRKLPTEISKYFSSNRVWIFKPVKGFQGMEISIVKNFKELEEVYLKERNIYLGKSKLNKDNKHPKNKGSKKNNRNLNTNTSKPFNKTKKKGYQRWVCQEYIQNPMLYENRKFHLRTYFIYVNRNGIINSYVLKMSQVLTGATNYKANNFNQKAIHNTHFYSTDKPIYFPRDFIPIIGKTQSNNILSQIVNLYRDVSRKTKIKCYTESKSCFQIMGGDIMITESGEVKLIEINGKIAFGTLPQDPFNFNYYILENVMDILLERYNLDGYLKI